jgi:hypothetical protein
VRAKDEGTIVKWLETGLGDNKHEHLFELPREPLFPNADPDVEAASYDDHSVEF